MNIMSLSQKLLRISSWQLPKFQVGNCQVSNQVWDSSKDRLYAPEANPVWEVCMYLFLSISQQIAMLLV